MSEDLRPIDIDIIRCLQEDARCSFASIATRVGVPESTVRNRVNRLKREGIVEFAAITNPLRLGYQIWTLIDIQTHPGTTRNVALQLAKVPDVYWVGITTGTHDVHVGAIFRSNKELLDFVTRRIPKIRGIVRTSTVSILELIKHRWDGPLATSSGDGGRLGARRAARRQRARPKPA